MGPKKKSATRRVRPLTQGKKSRKVDESKGVPAVNERRKSPASVRKKPSSPAMVAAKKADLAVFSAASFITKPASAGSLAEQPYRVDGDSFILFASRQNTRLR